MKKNTILFVLFAFACLYMHAQTNHPFPTENAHWNIYAEFSDMDSPPDTTLLRYALHGDTVINSVTYSRLCLETGSLSAPQTSPVGGLREDNGVVYYTGYTYLELSSTEEIVLYDFTKQAGDTVFHNTNEGFFTVIESIDSVEIAGEFRKRFMVNSSMNFNFDTEYWIEGIGSIQNGLLGHITPIPTCCYHYWEHVCFMQDGNVLHLNPVFDKCFPQYLVGAPNKTLQNEICTFPNPVKEALFIEGLPGQGQTTVRLFSVTGQLVMNKPVTNGKIIFGTEIRSGMYILLVQNTKGDVLLRKPVIKK